MVFVLGVNECNNMRKITIEMLRSKDHKISNMPNKFAGVKYVAKGEEVIKDNKDHTYAFVNEFLEEAMKISNIYETDKDVDNEFWLSNHNAHATLSISNSLHNKCMNLLHLPK
jgi:hypothetical protein